MESASRYGKLTIDPLEGGIVVLYPYPHINGIGILNAKADQLDQAFDDRRPLLIFVMLAGRVGVRIS